VLWNIDNGQSVNLAGIPDALLRSMLLELFTHLQLKSSAKVSDSAAMHTWGWSG
jgi:hypothetical protein